MGVNISGRGVLAGLGALIVGASNVVSALRTLLYGYTTTGTPGTQGGSYYTTYVGSASAGYVMTTNDGNVFYTLDLQGEWTAANQNLGDWGWKPPVYIEELSMYFVGSQYGRTAYSYDGLNWTMGATLFPNAGFSSSTFKYANGIFVAMNTQDGMTAYSTDGLNWTENNQTLDSLLGQPSGVPYGFSYNQNIQFAFNKFIIIGDYGVIAYSADGANWSVQDSGEAMNSQTNILFVNNQLLIPLIDGGILVSNDGINWSKTSSFPGYVYDITYTNGYYLAAPGNSWGSSANTVYAGTSLSAMSAVLTESVSDIVSGNPTLPGSLAVILSAEGKVYSSLNSSYTSWGLRFQLPGSTYIVSVADRSPLSYVDGVYTIGYTDFNTYESSLYTSQDGFTWSYKTISSPTDSAIFWPWAPEPGTVSTLREVQSVIGGQGEDGSFVESLDPVFLYDHRTMPRDPTNPNSIRLKLTVTNSGNTDEYVTAGESFDGGITFDSSGPVYVSDVLVAAGQTVTLFDNINVYVPSWSTAKLYVLGTKADVLSFKVYDGFAV
jgi:hypothetical protein